MNESEKKELFSLTGKDFSTVSTMDFSDMKAPEVLTLTDKIRNYRIKQKDFELTKELIKTPEAGLGKRIGEGVSEAVNNLLLVPEEVKNIRRRLFTDYNYPNATREQALALADASSNEIANIKRLRAEEQIRQGIKPDDWVKNLSSGVAQVGMYSLLSYATGGAGLALAGVQEAGEASQDWYESFQEKNKGVDIYDRENDVLAAVGHGAVAGIIERGLGAERLFSPLIARKVFAKTGAKRAIRAGVIGGVGEAAEESLQDASRYAFGHMTGADTRTTDELLQEMATDAIYAAVVGGVAGGGAYYMNRSRMIGKMSDMGMSQTEATQATDEILDEGTQYILNDFVVRDHIQKGYGQEFNNLVTKIKDTITATGRTDLVDEKLDSYAKLNAVNLVMPAINIANLQRIPVSEVLNLANIVVEGNAMHIDMPNINDPEKLEKEIKTKEAELKYLNSQIAVDNKDRKKSLRLKIKLLKNRLKTLTGNEEIYNARNTAKKAKRDQRVIAETKPEIVADLKGIRNANNENFVYVGETKLPVQYEVRSLDEVQPSHINGEPNPNYTLKELQNRTRGTMVDEAILQNRAANLKPEELGQSPNTQYGAPLVNYKNEVISGNGRLETLRKAYDLGAGQSYINMLNKMGYDTNGIERPVLVRKTVDDLTPEQQVAVAEASNVSQTSAFDHARQAMNDAKKLGKKVIDVVTFADNLPVTERQAYIKEDGTYDMLALQRRFDDAVMAYVIGDAKTFDALVLSDKIPHKVSEGLSRQGAAIVQFDHDYPEMGLKKDIRNALVKISAMKNRAEYISVIQQRDIEDGMTFSSDALLYGMAFSNNSSQVNNFMDYYIQRHKNYLEGEKENLLADALPKFSKEDITSQILRNSPLTADKFDKEGVTTDANLKAMFLNKIPASDELYNTTMPLMLKQTELARLDSIYPEYTAETITADGKERTVYNSNGERIAKSKEALENFYKWFGDSKVVDEQGRPLVVYHGTDFYFNEFRMSGGIDFPDAAYFSSNKNIAKTYTNKKNIMKLYLKMENPYITDAEGQSYNKFYDSLVSDMDWAVRNDYDGVIIRRIRDDWGQRGKGGKIGDTYAVFEPNQIKSTSNRGTYSIDEDNIYYQFEDIGRGIKYSKNFYDLKRLLSTMPKDEDIRIMFDSSKGYWFAGKSFDVIHNDMIQQAFKSGLYPEFRTSYEAQQYFDESTYNDENLYRFVAMSYEDGNYQKAIDNMGDDYSLAYIIPTNNDNGVVLFARGQDEIEGAGLTEIAKDAIIYDVQYKKIISTPDTYAQRSQANGFFDAELKTVVLGSNFNYGTLPHEFAHFWLDKMFTMWKSGDTTAEFNEMFQGLADILGITKEQTSLTTNQHEQYAAMTEGYLFNKAAFPDGAKPAMNLFFEWCPEQYQSLLDIGYRDEEGNIHNPIFTDEALKWFDDFYANMVGLNNSHISLIFDNPDDQNGDKMTSPETTIANRERLIDGEHPDSLDVMKNQPQAVKEAFVESQDKEIPLVKEAYEEAVTREETREKTIPEKIKQYVKIGRGTNTREGMDKAAQEYIKNNPERAEQIAFGSPIAGGIEGFEGWTTGDPYVENDSGIDRAVLIINVMAKYGEDTPQYAALYHNLALTRSYAGKTGGLTNDISQQFYLKGYAEINRALESKAALARYGKGSNSVDLWNRDIDRFIQDNVDAIFSTEPESAERDKALNKFFEKASKVLGADNPDQFLQESLNRARKMTKKDRQQFIEFARREIKKKAGGEMSAKDVSKLMNLSIEAQKAAIDIDSNDINKAKSASIAIRSWQDFVNSKGVQKTFLDKLVGEWMPRAMLSGISTHVVNNVSNFVNDTFVKAATIFHFGNNVVSTQVINREQERLWAIYNATGQNLAESIRVDQVSKLHAENYQLPQATTLLQKVDPFRLLGKEDFYFRSKRYLDTLARIASKDAKGDVKEANRLFNEYKKMNSTDERAIEARMQAITVGNIAVFTCDGQLAKMISNMRRELDRINLVEFGEKGHYGLGTLIAPFAKVPTNIVGMGLEAIASPFKSLAYLTRIKKNWTIQDTIALETFAGSIATVLVYIAGACDYEPPYEPPMPYDPDKPYDSIKIGNVWVQVETFGAFSTPLRFALTMVHAHNQGYTNEKALSKGLKTIASQVPLIENNMEFALNKPFRWLEGESYNQVNKAVPALIKPVIRAANRETGANLDWWDPEFMPVWRKKFAKNYGFDGEETSINDWIHFIYGKAWVDKE